MISYTRVPGEATPTKSESRMVLAWTGGVKTGVTTQKCQLGKIKKNLLGMGWWVAA